MPPVPISGFWGIPHVPVLWPYPVSFWGGRRMEGWRHLQGQETTQSQLMHFPCLINNLTSEKRQWPRCSELKIQQGQG